METQSIPDSALPARQYPAPPAVHWLALLPLYAIYCVFLLIFVPAYLLRVIAPIFDGAWAIYLCLWIRDLNPRTKTLIFADANLGVLLAAGALGLFAPPGSLLNLFVDLLLVIRVVLYLYLIYGVRDELVKHYNKREPAGLQLGPVATFFFSFYYFQYHLYRIAKQKQTQSGVSFGPPQTPLA
jgi:hypothetical protein